MDGNITINIVEPGTPPSPAPIDPVAPNTGLFTSGTSGPEATIITAISAVLILTIVAIIITSLLYRKQKKSGKVTKLVHLVDSTKAVLKFNKHITTAIILLAILTSTGTFIALAKNAVNASENDEQATEDTNDSSLTVDVSSEELTIEVANEPVFAVLPVEVTVEEATEAGYTLTAYTDNTDLVSTTNPDNIIPMVTLPESSVETLEPSETAGELVALANNTYGLALEEKPTTKDEAVYTALSTDLSSPTILKAIDDYSSTPANDTTTIYYGFYITPDVPYGTYTGSTISYEAIPNLATISYNAAGLYYNNDESFTTNTVGYKPSTPDSPIEELTGEYLAPAPLTPVDPSTPIHYTFLGWSKTEGATTPDYEDEEDIIASLTLSPNEDLTLYAVWHYDTILSFNGNTSDGGEPIADITIPAGTTITLPPNTYTRTGSVFTGWNTVAIPTEQDPGEAYEDEADFTAPDSSADITLYAQWAYYTTITFNGNGETSGYMSPQDIIAGTPENLVPNAYTKTNHTFIGWNTVQNPTPGNPGTTYQDQAEFIASSTQHEDITLYAQWAATTISFNGNTSESGTMNPITIPGGEQVTLPQNTYTKSHCSFTSWNTNPDGTGTRYPGEASYTASMDGIYSFTLYAQWQCESMINFSGNGATSGYMPGIMATGGQQTTLPPNTFTKDGYSFNGWNTVAEPTEQDPGESYPDQGTYIAPVSESQNITLYAQWAATTITFSGNGATGGSMGQFNIPAGTTANLPQNTFTRTGYVFNGWNTSPDGTGTSYSDQSSYYATAGVNTSVTLHAQWLPTTTITFNGNGETSGTMSDQVIVAGTPENLTPNAYAKDGYVFNGWNTVQTPTTENPGTVYADKASYSASTTKPDSFTLYAQWIDCAPNSICYNDNGADSPTTMSDQSASSNTETTLWASNYKYDTNNDRHNDYGFAGWSEDKDAATKLVDNDPTNNPVVYGPNQTITTGDLSLEGMKLYAVWIAPEENTTFQTFTCPSNTDMPIGTVMALKDNRDNEVYTVAKLADGNCWMTENLRLDNNAAINSTNTHSPSFTALRPSSSSWCAQSKDVCINQSMLNTNNIASAVSEMTGTNANISSYSNYYNWYSATAGNGKYNTYKNVTVAGDICPAGWHLPYGGHQTSEKGGNTSGGFYYLNNRIGGNSNAWRSFPNNFVYSGGWYGSWVDSRGNSGRYWSSTASGSISNAYRLSFGSDYSGSGDSSETMYYGASVRCVAPAE